MDFLIAFAAFLIGAILSFFLSYYGFSRNRKKLEEKLKFAENNFIDANNKLDAKAESLQNTINNYEARISELKQNFEKQIQDKEAQFQNQKSELKDSFEVRISELNKSHKEQIESQLKTFEELRNKFKDQFSNLANDILDQKSEKFSQQGKRDINELLKPFKEQLKNFEDRVERTYNEGSKERFSLRTELKNLMEANQKLNEEAKNLSQALKGESKTQGDWGEMILENILEGSGLRENHEYFKQHNIKSDDGRNLRPDFVVKYPGEKYLIIDSKVSLTHYEQYISAESEKDKEHFLKLHINSIKKHIKELEEKKYEKHIKESTPEFVIMFLPIEAAYLIAMQHENSLWNDAYKKRIVLISPTNLITSLKIISTLWEHDTQNKNVIAIAEESGKLYDKFVGFIKDLEKIDEHLKKASDSYSDAHKKLVSGRGNLIGKAQKIKSLGAVTSKNLDEKYSHQHELKLLKPDDDE
jgi:DNA recombination protein RmuC